jgi:PAS domain S-box-containing protein
LKENLDEKYRYLINNIQDSIIETDFDGTITYINPYVYSMFGYQQNELIGTNAFKFIHPKDLSYYKEVVQKGIKSGGNFSVEFRAHHKKGHYVPISGKCNVVKINGNNKIIGVLRDITERKKIEKALIKSEELFRTIFDTAIDSIFIKDTSLRYVKVNSAMKKLFGKKSEGLLYKTDIDLFGEEIGKHIMEADKQVIKGKIIEEFPTKPINGVNHSFHTIKIPLKDMKGKIVGLYGIARDITELKKAEKKLRESEEKYRMISENANDLIVIINEKFEYEYINEIVHKKLMGYAKEDIIGKSSLDFIHPDDIKYAVKGLKQGFINEVEMGEVRIRNKKGEYLWLEIRGKSFIDKYGKKKGLLISRDISDRKKAEQKLKESEEKYRTLVEKSLQGICILQNIRLVFANNALAEILGYTIEELLSLSSEEVKNLIHPEDREYVVNRHINRLEGKPVPTRYEFRVIRKDQKVRVVEMYATRIEYEGKTSIQEAFVDITERKSAEQKLKESEKEYRDLFESSPYAIGLIDMNGKIIHCNSNVERIFGYKPEEYLDKNFNYFKLFSKKDNKIVIKSLKKLIKEEIPEPQEFQLRRKDGNVIWVLIQASLVKRINETLIQVITQDITNRKEAELKLKESEEKYRLISENAKDLITIINEKYEHEFINEQTYQKVLGYCNDDMLGKTRLDLVHPDDLRRGINAYKNGFEAGEGTVELRLRHKQGHYIWFEFKGKTYIDREGKTKGLLISRDISDRKKAEQLLKESEKRFRTLYKNIAGGTIIIDEDCVIKDVNDRTCEITGYTKEELIGQLCDILCPRGSSSKECPIWVMGQEGFRGMDTAIKCKDGKENPILKNAKKIELDGKNYILENFQDITERKMAEIKLQEINELKTEIMRRVSHELKTPLISIKGFSDLLLDVHYNKFDDDIISIVNEIKQGCVRLENLIDEILESSKLDSRQIKLKTSKEDLSFLIRFCVEELKMLLKMRNQAIILNIHDNLITVFEKEKIYDVINNLLSNAIKYSQKNSEIKIQSEIKDNFIVISVNDNGIGFTEEEKTKLFTQFGKIERYGQNFDVESEGTGLGLYIAKKIVELHGGKIWMESEGRNKGSTFYFSLPMIKE